MTSTYVFDEKYLKIWYCFNGLAIGLNAMTLVFAIWTCWRYVYDKGVRKAMILLFYIAVFTVCIGSIIIGLLNIFEPERDQLEVNLYINAVKEISDAFLYLTVGLSMWQLGIALQTILDEVEPEEIARKECFMTVCIVIFLAIYSAILLIFVDYVRQIRLGVEGFIVILNTGILFWLRSKLQHLISHGF